MRKKTTDSKKTAEKKWQEKKYMKAMEIPVKEGRSSAPTVR